MENIQASDMTLPADTGADQSVRDDDAQAGTHAQETDDRTALSEALSQSENSAAKAGGAPQDSTDGDGAAGSSGAGVSGEEEKPLDSGIKGRINAEVRKALSGQQKAYEERLSRYEAEVSALREESLAREADALVAQGKVTDRDLALEYLRMKASQASQARNAGQADQPGQEAPAAQPRDEQGRFTAKQQEQPGKSADDAIKARAELLFGQAQAIAKDGGPDMLALFESDQEIHDKISSGAWDFKDAALHHLAQTGQRQRVPAPVRSPNHTQAQRTFASMSREELEAFDRRIENGEVFDARR